MFRHRYPPARYVCYPLYRYLRRRWRLPCVAAYFLVWLVSGVLHSAVLLAFGHPIAAGAFTLVFAGLGAAGAAAISIKNRRGNLRA
jgi:membrane associated rhomboid family serine protease